MNDQNNQISSTNVNDQELDYLYSLYKSSQSGSGVVMSKEEIKKLIDSNILVQKVSVEEDSFYKKRGISLNIPPIPDMSSIPNSFFVIQNMIDNLEK